MSTLVTCATGLVSQAFLRALREKGEPVHALIRDPLKASTFPREKVFIGDVFDPSRVRQAVAGVDTIVHVPPRVYPAGSTQTQLAMHRQAHVESTRLVLDQAVSQGVKKFLLVSSAHATGRNPDTVLCESEGIRPPTPYAQAKLDSEYLALAYGEKHRIDVVILRPPAIYGLGDRDIVSWMHRMARKNIWLPLRGLEVYHSLVFVDNLARAGLALLGLSQMARKHRVLIIKDATDYRPADVYAAVCRALGKPLMLFPAPCLALRALGALGAGCRRVPKVRGLSMFRQLATPQRYCGHLLCEALPDLRLVNLDEAVRTSLVPSPN